MNWSFKIGKIFGIPIRLHLTFLLLVLVFSVSLENGITVQLGGLLMVSLLFACVLAHELSHSLTAIRKGIPVMSITLLPIGGVAQMSTIPEEPIDEIQIALAGPAASYVIAVFVFLLAGSLQQADAVLQFSFYSENVLQRLFWANIILGTLNLVPAFPMDGGRVLRGFLASKMGMVAATRWAVTFGQAFAVMLYFAGALYSDLRWLILLAVFIYLGADAEEDDIEFRSEIAEVPARDAMLPRFDSLSPAATIPEALDTLRHSQQDDFPVLADDGKLVGMVAKNAVIDGLRELPPDAVISQVMSSDFIVCRPDTPMGRVFRQMEQRDKDIVPVVENGAPVGLISFDQIGRYYSLQHTKQKAKAGTQS